MYFIENHIEKRRLIILFGLLFYYSNFLFSQSSNITLTFSQGHLGEVTSLDISKDASLVISAGKDKKIKVWDLQQERLLRTINAHEIGITDIALSTDKQYIVSSGSDHKVRIWQTKTGMLLTELKELNEPVVEAKFQKNVVVFIDARGNIFHWDWQSEGSKVNGWTSEMTGGISCFITKPKSSSWTAFGKYNGEVEIWNSTQKKLKSTKKLHEDWVSDLRYIHDKKILVSGSYDGTLRVWNQQSDAINDPIRLPDNNGVRSITYSHSIDRLIVTSHGNHAYYYKVIGNDLELVSTFEDREIVTNAFNRKGELAVIAYKNGEIALWEIKGRRLKAAWKPILDKAIGFSASLTSNAIAVSSESGNIRLWESGSRGDLQKWKAHQKAISSIFFNWKGRLVTTSLDSTLKVWDHQNNYKLLSSRKFDYPIILSKLHPVDSLAFLVNNGGDLILQNLNQLQQSKTVFSSFNTITSLAISLDGSKVAVGLSNRSVHVLDLKNNFTVLKKIRVSDRHINTLAFSLDGQSLLVGSNHKLLLYDLKTGEIAQQREVDHPVKSIAFTFDGKYILLSEESGDLTSYSSDLKSQVYKYPQNNGDIIELFDFPGKQVFVTLSNDFAVGIWDLESPNRFGAVLSDGDVGWVVEHYSGLFDASETNMSNLYYVVDNEIIDIAQLQGMYWEPGLGTKLFNGQPLREVPFLSTVSLYPEANLYTKNDKLYIEVFDRGGGIGKVAVMVNNKEVLDDVTPYRMAIDVNHLNLNILKQKSQTIKYVVPMDTLSYLFQNGDALNNITVKVENKEGTLSGRGLTIRHKSKNTQKEIPSFYGIVIGVSDYRGTTLDLKYAADDAEKIASSIKESASELFGEHRVRVDLFSTNAEDPLYQPTKENIKNSFDSLQSLANPSDVLFVFLAGHGMALQEQNGEEDFYYLTKDMITADLKDQNIRDNYTIAGKEWLDWMKKIPVTRQVFIMDACNAGKFAETIIAMRNVDDESVRLRALERVRSRSGMYLLAGSAADKVSYESTMYGQGLLTYALLDYLKRGNLRKGEFVDVQMMFGNAVDEVPRLAERFGASQQPEMRIPEGGDSFDIGRVTDDLKSNINISTALSRVTSTAIEEDSSWVDHEGISKMIDERLLRLSEGLNSGYNYFTFSPFAKGEDVYQIKGRYTVVNDSIALKMKIVEGREQVYYKEYVADEKESLLERCIIDILNFFRDL
ncbi:caspase family protein [Flammeovirga sp. EKP202]|uniref:caspase family protein n=1 Tax=Flammeovirga sp. EKP202 TaxID=2770592 RepID=UPI00165F71C9|nr:caspase family protein [Flammeovirga sp. EKP202]MBD0401330.1 caspase family protein [Flammeovirga sp. EKP202]